MNKECTFKEYYGQFVNDSITRIVSNCIGKQRIKDSKDLYFNDIPLKHWDAIAPVIRQLCGKALSASNGSGGVSLSDFVCVAKVAAMQIRDTE